MAASGESHSVLVLGGTGFIGRHLVDYLVRQNGVKKIRVVDKVPPAVAWMNATHTESFNNPMVEFRHSNLINKASTEKAFAPDGEPFDFVVNLAAETKFGQSEPVYREGIHKLSMNCAEEATRHRIKRFIEVSTAQVYSSDKKSAREDSKLDPWTNLARQKLEVEKSLANLSGLDYVVVRPVTVYGTGDKNGLTPRLIIGSLYKYMQKKMHLLWTKDLQMNTVHVTDVVRAIWHLCHNGNRGQVYNLADQGETTQGDICGLISELYNINYDFLGTTMSNITRVRMHDTVKEINDRHMRPWSDACHRDGITNTHLTPFLDQELLYNRHLHADGSKVTLSGFSYTCPKLQLSTLQEILQDYIILGLLPPCLMKDGQHLPYTPPSPLDHLTLEPDEALVEQRMLGAEGDEEEDEEEDENEVEDEEGRGQGDR